MLSFQKRIRDWAESPESMIWEQLSVNKPHLAYLIIGGFTSLFMLCSLFVKEKLYIGEATVATLCGVIFGPHAANLFNPLTWGNTDQITLECSRVVLVVQCFAVGVELPKAYMERHWRSVVFLLVPVMTFGWLITSLFIWWMIEPLSWLESLMCAACVTATDPVLASSVVGKGKFAKRVPKHLRDLLSAESGCNDGMAFPFIYLSFYLIHYKLEAKEVTFHWICNTILYECIFGCIYGVMIGYLGRHAIKWADRKDLIDRESFLVFYFVLALFAAGTGATLGTDDLLVGFAAGVGFSNDGWFTEKTEESHVSNVIDLLLNLAYFVYLGSIIPWEQYNNPVIGLTPWRLVIIAIFVVLFRRIPIVMMLKPLIPDIKTWREALFAGHFGPIGVGAIFAAILARAELETGTTEPLAVIPTDPNSENYAIVQIIWPLTTFLVVTSILVHGSSIAVFTLGKRINSFTLTMSYTQAHDEGPTWMNRLPRIASTSKTMSKGRDDFSTASSTENLNEKLNADFLPGQLPPPGGLPRNFLRRQKEEETPIERPRQTRRKSRWDAGMGPGGPIERSAITPQRRSEIISPAESASDTLNEKSESPSSSYNADDKEDMNEPPDQLQMEDAQEKRDSKKKQGPRRVDEPELEVFDEGDDLVVEDEEGETIGVHHVRGESDAQKRQHILEDEEILRSDGGKDYAKGKFHPHERNEGEEIEEKLEKGLEHPEQAGRSLFKRLGKWDGFRRKERDTADAAKSEPSKAEEAKSGVPARAYQFGHTLIVEDEDGEVLKKIDLTMNGQGRSGGGTIQSKLGTESARGGLKRMGTWAGIGRKDDAMGEGDANGEASNQGKGHRKSEIDADDDRIRFTVGTGGRRMSKQEFIQQLNNMDPRARTDTINESDVPEAVKEEVRADAAEESRQRNLSISQPRAAEGKKRSPNRSFNLATLPEQEAKDAGMPLVRRISTSDNAPKGDDNLALVDSNENTIPFHNVPESIRKHAGSGETAAQRRRRLALQRRDSDDDGSPRVAPVSTQGRRAELARQRLQGEEDVQDGETQAERRRRLAALGEGAESDSDSEDDGQERRPRVTTTTGQTPVAEASRTPKSPGIRFADSPAVSQGRIQWGEDVRKGNGKGKR